MLISTAIKNAQNDVARLTKLLADHAGDVSSPEYKFISGQIHTLRGILIELRYRAQ